MVVASQRFSNASNPCPICGGHDKMKRGTGMRCNGFVSTDEKYIHCQREERAGIIQKTPGSQTYAHLAQGSCKCGETHGEAPSPNTPTPRPAIVREPTVAAEYPYKTASGDVSFVVQRMSDKSFRQYQPMPNGQKQWSTKGADTTLVYHRPEVDAAIASGEDTIYVTEGEKDVETLRRLDLVATCNSMGAGKWTPDHAKQLLGATDVRVIADDDEAGWKHVQKVMQTLQELPVPVQCFRSRSGKDITDHLNAGHTLEDLIPVTDPATELKRISLPRSPAKSFSAVKMKPVDWLWKGYIPAGKVTMLDGDPGQGKTAISLDLCSRITNGEQWPDNTGCDAAHVIYVSTEDDVDDTLAPRMAAAGVNFHNASYIDEVNGVPVNLQDHLDDIEAAITHTGSVFLVLDHILALIKDKDSNSATEASSVMRNIRDVARRTGCAIMVLRHLNKSGVGPAWTRGIGSGQFAAVVRSGLMVDRPGDHADDEQQNPVFGQYKSSVGPNMGSLEYRLDQVLIDNPTQPDQKIETVKVKWLGASSLRADQFNAERRKEKSRTPTESQAAARDFLEAQLAAAESPETAVDVADLRSKGESIGISKQALYSARDAVSAKSTGNRGKSGSAGWYIPPDQSDMEF